ncbi:MAG: radical SAM protein [Clostridiales bacterium]|nr:radical SAM protein [Clostridiales bacterium]
MTSAPCIGCPRDCAAAREAGRGFCGANALARVARADLHLWEEPPISGTRGSGAVFFSGCNMRCIFCQNRDISQQQRGQALNAGALASVFLKLAQKGAHNINLVTPNIHLAAVIPALRQARAKGLSIPVVYNTNGFDSIAGIRALDGLVDIYLPDIKFVSPELSGKISRTAAYLQYAAPALLEMQRQTGTLQLDDAGIARRGLLVRHLVLPGCLHDTRRVIDFIRAHLPQDTCFSLMGQYTPNSEALPPPYNRRLTAREYRRATAYCLDSGLKNVYVQSLSSAEPAYIPAFSDELTNL